MDNLLLMKNHHQQTLLHRTGGIPKNDAFMKYILQDLPKLGVSLNFYDEDYEGKLPIYYIFKHQEKHDMIKYFKNFDMFHENKDAKNSFETMLELNPPKKI